MKVFELAKKLDVKTTDLIEKLVKSGVEIKGPNQNLSEDVVDSVLKLTSENKSLGKVEIGILLDNTTFTVRQVVLEDDAIIEVKQCKTFANISQAIYFMEYLLNSAEMRG